jgi:hypothetical protein
MKRSLLLALLLSLLLHLLLLGSGILPTLSTGTERPLQPVRMHLASMALSPAPSGNTALPPVNRVQMAPLPASAGNGKRQKTAASVPASHAASMPVVVASAATAATEEHAAVMTEHVKHKKFPTHALLRYQVFYGAFLAGNASIDWQREGDRYHLSNQIVSVIGQRLRYVSQGTIGPAGLRPETYTAWRNEEQREQARFDWKNAQLEYGDGESKSTRLDTGAQDILSLIYQLALKGSGNPPVQITTGKQVYRYPLAPTGEAELETDAGKIHALVFHAQGDDSQTEFWLSPEYANQPVRIIFTNSKMKLDLRITDIEIDQSIQWHQPKQLRKNNR